MGQVTSDFRQVSGFARRLAKCGRDMICASESQADAAALFTGLTRHIF